MPRVTRTLLFLSLLALSATLIVTAVRAAEDDPIAEALARPILAPGQALEEFRSYCEQRVPRMPKVETAEEWQAYADHTRAEVLKRVIFRGEAKSWRDPPP